ncbi:MAG: VCBS repeat-containing protein [Planctomycetota bacterium]
MRPVPPLSSVSLSLALLAAPALAQQPILAEVHRMLPAEAEFSNGVAIGDVDGDSDPDLLLDSYRLLLGRGNGVFENSDGLPPSTQGFDGVVLADLDGDGDLDAFLGGTTNTLLLNDGSGAFTAAPEKLPADSGSRVAAAGDVDGDGDVDLVLGYSSFTSASLYLNDGTAGFTKTPGGFLGSVFVSDVTLLDIEGDGDPDVLFGFSSGGQRLYRNDAGFFTDVTVTQLPNVGVDVNEFGSADLDADGDLDVVVANSLFNRYYENDGDGTFADVPEKLVGAPSSATSVSLGDVDGDGGVDAMLGSVLENALLLNDGTGVLSLAPESYLPRTEDTTYGVRLFDADDDGDLDNWVINSAQDRLQLNDGSGVFAQDEPNLPAYEDYTRFVLLVDVNGDGADDAVVGNAGEDRMYLGDGVGFFTGATDNLPVPENPAAGTARIAAGDVDGDGDQDLFMSRETNDKALYLNDGAGVFADATDQVPQFALESARETALVDLDGDGDLDAYVVNSATKLNRLHLNDGGGVFTDAPAQHPDHKDSSWAVNALDVDGDGDLDLLVGNTYGQNRLYVNDGAASFADAQAQIPVIQDNTHSVASADVDGDGDSDVLLGNGFQQNALWLNDGSGTFIDGTAGALPADGAATLQVVLGDIDGDGHVDALLANAALGEEANSLYLGDGAGGFVDASDRMPQTAEATYSFALGDIDGDDDLDVLVGNDGLFQPQQNRLYTNLTRHVAWSGLPRVGQAYDVDVYGVPTEPWFLAWGLGTLSFPLPPFGTLRLNPGTTLVVDASGTFPTSGVASKTFPGTDDPSFVGQSLYWQALVGNPLRFTNLEVMTFTDL